MVIVICVRLVPNGIINEVKEREIAIYFRYTVLDVTENRITLAPRRMISDDANNAVAHDYK